MEERGLDSDGKTYSSRMEMWRVEAGEDAQGRQGTDSAKKIDWYKKGVSYWEGVEASVDGVLGGYGNVNSRDVIDSNSFLLEILKECLPGAISGGVTGSQHLVALDCGAGVGRVTKNLLLHHFNEVDLVEPVRHFLDAAQADLCDKTSLDTNSSNGQRAENFYCSPLQDFTPEAGRYDVIWVQWCIGHLTDHDLVAFFKRAQIGLKPGGFFVVKENIAKNGFVVDKADSSVTRSDAYFQDLFRQTGLYLHKSRLQKGFPRDLFAVRMYALTTEQCLSPSQVPHQSRTQTYHKNKTRRRGNQPRIIP